MLLQKKCLPSLTYVLSKIDKAFNIENNDFDLNLNYPSCDLCYTSHDAAQRNIDAQVSRYLIKKCYDERCSFNLISGGNCDRILSVKFLPKPF